MEAQSLEDVQGLPKGKGGSVVKYVQYYEKRDGEFIAPCGDRCVLILDGRNSLITMHQDAVKNNGVRRPLYNAYRLYKGSFRESVPISTMRILT